MQPSDVMYEGDLEQTDLGEFVKLKLQFSEYQSGYPLNLSEPITQWLQHQFTKDLARFQQACSWFWRKEDPQLLVLSNERSSFFWTKEILTDTSDFRENGV